MKQYTFGNFTETSNTMDTYSQCSLEVGAVECACARIKRRLAMALVCCEVVLSATKRVIGSVIVLYVSAF